MITWGFVASYSDLAVNDVPFPNGANGLPMPSSYLYVSGAGGNIVWKNVYGDAQYIPNALTGQYFPVGAVEILASGVVNGVARTTSATGIVYMSSNSVS